MAFLTEIPRGFIELLSRANSEVGPANILDISASESSLVVINTFSWISSRRAMLFYLLSLFCHLPYMALVTEDFPNSISCSIRFLISHIISFLCLLENAQLPLKHNCTAPALTASGLHILQMQPQLFPTTNLLY